MEMANEPHTSHFQQSIVKNFTTAGQSNKNATVGRLTRAENLNFFNCGNKFHVFSVLAMSCWALQSGQTK